MANEYKTLAEMKATLSMTGETFADPDISEALEAASRGIDLLCGRRFYPDADALQVRYFTATGDQVFIDDLITLTSLKTDASGAITYADTWTIDTDFYYGPDNALAEGRPYEVIRRHPNAVFSFPAYPRAVKVTGRFGWAAAPPVVKQLTTILAHRLLRRAREAPFGIVTVGIDAGAAMRIAQMDPEMRLLIHPYMKVGRGIG